LKKLSIMDYDIEKSSTEIFWIEMTNITFQWLIDKIMLRFSDKKKTFITTPNPEILNKSLKDKEFRNILKKSEFATPDGIGLYLAYQVLNYKNIFIRIFILPYAWFNILFRKKYLWKKYWDKICGSDLTLAILDIASQKEIKIWIIDPKQVLNDEISKKKKYIQENFDELFGKKYPKLEYKLIVYDGNNEKLYQTIKKEKIQIAFSTIGMKKQEIMSFNILKNTNCLLTLWIGSSFDYITGFQKRAPKKYGNNGFEWVYRLIVNPWRWKRLKRIYNATIVFTFNVILSK